MAGSACRRHCRIAHPILRSLGETMNKNEYPVPESFAAAAQVNRAGYQEMYADSIENPNRFWDGIGRRIDLIEGFSQVKDSNFSASDFHIRWFPDGKLNVASNCLDRH